MNAKKEAQLIKKANLSAQPTSTECVTILEHRRSGINVYHCFRRASELDWSCEWVYVGGDYFEDNYYAKIDWAFPSLNVRKAPVIEVKS